MGRNCKYKVAKNRRKQKRKYQQTQIIEDFADEVYSCLFVTVFSKKPSICFRGSLKNCIMFTPFRLDLTRGKVLYSKLLDLSLVTCCTRPRPFSSLFGLVTYPSNAPLCHIRSGTLRVMTQ